MKERTPNGLKVKIALRFQLKKQQQRLYLVLFIHCGFNLIIKYTPYKQKLKKLITEILHQYVLVKK